MMLSSFDKLIERVSVGLTDHHECSVLPQHQLEPCSLRSRQVLTRDLLLANTK